MRLLTVIFTSLVLLLKLADLGTHAAFSRPFNPLLDAKILHDGWNLLSGTVGLYEAIAIIASALLCWLFTGVLLHWSLGALRLIVQRRHLLFAAAAVFAVGLAGNLFARLSNTPDLRADLRLLPFITERMALMRRSIIDLRIYEAELAHDPLSMLPPAKRLMHLRGMDVIMVFVESYGASAINAPPYAPATRWRLQKMQDELALAGLHAKSSWLLSPTSGGLSWLAHGALLSGTWTDSQQRYDRLIASERQSLNAIFRESGWRSIAVMPAIVLDWPEAAYFGYERVLAAGDLGYEGLPFNWVTMPDQYTLAAFEREERTQSGRPAVFAEIALISSHAPWTPVPRVVDWSRVGDGTIFNTQVRAGQSPAAVWADEHTIRDHYIRTIDYALETLGQYMARFSENTLFIILGDHQPAQIITGQNATRAVPIHIVAKDPALLARLSGQEWTQGLLPAPDPAPRRMDEFREAFVRAFSP
ncbi:hypothetical protein GCM10010136_14600 [Limoniibacter endophyticus]|uniref:Phosphoglycerol transferase MdoB-like AlkP superfamily enzyme n=1 Tax=Limoniibacter endophyticus TaxID=1565040 RepID=A0A8J3DI37_9HYPH|nr:hypothetical protein GCM10010136_14600 [Limoniibacter endophyticus]